MARIDLQYVELPVVPTEAPHKVVLTINEHVVILTAVVVTT